MRTGNKYWLNRGFAPHEASAFKNITTEAINDSRPIQVMIKTRMRRFREFYQKYPEAKNTLDLYYAWVRKQYVDKGFTDNPKDLFLTGDIQHKNKARTLAFDFFNSYKEKYAIRDASGKLIETPRKKTRASRKPITRDSSINQTIEQSLQDIEFSKSRLRYAKTDKEQQEWRDRIKRHQDRIAKLKLQK